MVAIRTVLPAQSGPMERRLVLHGVLALYQLTVSTQPATQVAQIARGCGQIVLVYASLYRIISLYSDLCLR
jgi:hypothetical protein